tara:strand:+ start:247 stop:879 length:633 start_codon:yes stop_codon:yes gene_type:complete
MIELLDYDIFHTHEAVYKSDQLCNLVNDEEFDIELGIEMCLFTEVGNAEYFYIDKTKTIYVKNESGNQKTSETSEKTVPKTITENLKLKTYSKFGQMCSICYEPIISRQNAMILKCGHSFHKNCVKDWFLSCIRSQDDERLNNSDLDICKQCVCPLCRGMCSMLHGECDIGNDRYNYKGERELVDKYHLMYTCPMVDKLFSDKKWIKVYK